MHREPDRAPECSVCGCSSLSLLTKRDPPEGFLQVHFALPPHPRRGWLADDRARLAITRARVCLECGHVMLFLAETRLAELKAMLPKLEPVPEE